MKIKSSRWHPGPAEVLGRFLVPVLRARSSTMCWILAPWKEGGLAGWCLCQAASGFSGRFAGTQRVKESSQRRHCVIAGYI